MAVLSAHTLVTEVSPSIAYERLAEAALLAYETTLGVSKIPLYWDAEKVEAASTSLGESLLLIAEIFAASPRRPTSRSLVLDLARVHHGMGNPLSVPAPFSTPSRLVEAVAPGKPQPIKTCLCQGRVVFIRTRPSVQPIPPTQAFSLIPVPSGKAPEWVRGGPQRGNLTPLRQGLWTPKSSMPSSTCALQS